MTSFVRAIVGSASLLVISACSANVTPSTASLGVQPPAVSIKRDASKIKVKPSKITLDGIGKKYEQTVLVHQSGYTGVFSSEETVDCMEIVNAAPSSGSGPKMKVLLIGKKKGSCPITYLDSTNNNVKATLTVTVK